MWNGTMFVDLDWPLNASSLLSASAELLVNNSGGKDAKRNMFSDVGSSEKSRLWRVVAGSEKKDFLV